MAVTHIHNRDVQVSRAFMQDAFTDDPAYWLRNLKQDGLILSNRGYLKISENPLCEAPVEWGINEDGDLNVYQPVHSCSAGYEGQPRVISIERIGNGLEFLYDN